MIPETLEQLDLKDPQDQPEQQVRKDQPVLLVQQVHKEPQDPKVLLVSLQPPRPSPITLALKQSASLSQLLH